MQEPELEEEALRAEPEGETLVIERRSLETLPDEITVLSPSGQPLQTPLEQVTDGLGRASLEAEEAGLYRISDDDLTTYAAVHPIAGATRAHPRALRSGGSAARPEAPSLRAGADTNQCWRNSVQTSSIFASSASSGM